MPGFTELTEARQAIKRLDLERYWRPWGVIREAAELKVPQQARPSLLGVCGSAYRTLTRLSEAHACILYALTQQPNREPEYARLLQRLATIDLDRRNLAAYRDRILEAREIYLHSMHLEGLGMTLVDLALAALFEGNFKSATVQAEAAHQYPIGQGHIVAAHQIVAKSLLRMGSWQEAVTSAEEAFKQAGNGPAFFSGKALWLVAEIAEATGDLERAEGLLSQALDYLTVSPADQVSCAAQIGLYRSRLGNYESAEEIFDYALQVLKDHECPAALRRAFRDARIAARVGRDLPSDVFEKLQERVMHWKTSPVR